MNLFNGKNQRIIAAVIAIVLVVAMLVSVVASF